MLYASGLSLDLASHRVSAGENLLDEVRNQSQATVDAIGAQRDFWLAEADLQWVLQGGEPDSFVSLGGAGGDAPTAAAH